jgi:RecA/RadA recombinase
MASIRQIRVRYKYDEDDIAIIEKMFAGMLRRKVLSDERLEQERMDNVSKFITRFRDNIFQDEYAILYELVATRRITTGDWTMMEAVINENKELILSAPQVNLAQFAADFTESDEYEAFMSMTKAAFERICDMEFIGSEGFDSAVNSFIELFERKYTRQCLNIMGAILSNPDPYVDYRSGRRKEYQGYAGVKDFFLVESMRIDSLRRAQGARQFTLGSEWLDEQLDEKRQAEKAAQRELLCKLGIPEIDNVWAGIRRTHMVGIIGPPKGGKTTLSAYMVHRLLKAGRRVAVWAMEGSAEESWINKLIAAICFEQGYNITSKDLADGLVGKTEEERRAVINARLAIAQNENLSFIEETGYVEDFLDVIDGHYKTFNHFDCLVVDSLLNLQTKTGRKKTEYLSSAYILLKNYIEHELTPRAACIVTAQFKQEAIKEARNKTDISFDETSGGETAETIRTPDNVLGIFSTPEERDNHVTTIYHIASRHSEQFKPAQVRALFGYAQFSSLNEIAGQ